MRLGIGIKCHDMLYNSPCSIFHWARMVVSTQILTPHPKRELPAQLLPSLAPTLFPQDRPSLRPGQKKPPTKKTPTLPLISLKTEKGHTSVPRIFPPPSSEILLPQPHKSNPNNSALSNPSPLPMAAPDAHNDSEKTFNPSSKILKPPSLSQWRESQTPCQE